MKTGSLEKECLEYEKYGFNLIISIVWFNALFIFDLIKWIFSKNKRKI